MTLEVGATRSTGAGGTGATTTTGMGGAGTTSSTSTTWTTSSTWTTGTTSTTSRSSASASGGGTGGSASSSSSSSSSSSGAVAVTGTLVELTPPIGIYGIALDADYVYATGYEAGQVVKVPKGGGPPIVVAAGLANPSFMALDDARVYFATFYSSNKILSVPKDGGTITDITPSPNVAGRLTVDATHVYCAAYAAGEVIAIDKTTGVPTTLATTPFLRALFDDGELLFWSPNGAGFIRSVPKRGRGDRRGRGP